MATKEPTENKPLSPIYYDKPGGMARLWTSGWACSCGAEPGEECEHIQAAKALYQVDNKKPQKGSEES